MGHIQVVEGTGQAVEAPGLQAALVDKPEELVGSLSGQAQLVELLAPLPGWQVEGRGAGRQGLWPPEGG
ncbi:MAG: hypothetical protein AMJ38_03015 [Dehalococcoidia bacterium DG_22]|nr:MAG: hypothetical protein AMJ38_03015 [Dehalococcoidia bacterium DG_22]